MNQTTTVGFIRNAADNHFSTKDKETFLTFMDTKLSDDAKMIEALEDLGAKITSNSKTVILQSGNDQSLNFEGHTGKLWQCNTCNKGFTKQESFKKKHAIGQRKSHKILRIFVQHNCLGTSR